LNELKPHKKGVKLNLKPDCEAQKGIAKILKFRGQFLESWKIVQTV
jgi:hypothetical protein